ncbi:MAG: MFS transporter [Sphaerochaetaceae bacterium]|jgi:predicted MFS family arabinose efflux permease
MKQSTLLNSASFVGQFAISMVNLAFVYYLTKSFFVSATMIGLAATLYTGSYFIFCLVLEPLTSSMKPRHSVELSMIGMAFSVGVILYTNHIAVVLVMLVMYGFFMSFLWPQVETWLARGKEGRELSNATSSFNVSWSVGTALSPLVTGALVMRNTKAPLYLGVILFIITYLFVAISTKRHPHLRAITSEKEHIERGDKVDESTPLRFVSWGGVVTVYTALAVILNIFPLYAMDELPFNEQTVGILLLLRGGATVVMFYYLGKSEWWHFNKPLILLTLLLFSLLCVWGTIINSFLSYALFFFLFGALFAASYSYSIFHGASGSLHRSKRMLIHETLLTLGTIIGSLVGGFVYQKINFDTVLYVCAIVVLIPVLFSGVSSLFAREKVLKRAP